MSGMGEAAAAEVEAALLANEAGRAEAALRSLGGIPMGFACLGQRAVNLARQGRRDAALILCRTVSARAPGDGVAIALVGYAYIALKMHQDGIEAALKAVRLAPRQHYGHTAAFAVMGVLADVGNLMQVLNEWARCFGFPGDVPRALAELWRLFAAGNERNLFRHLANVFLILGSAEQAVEAYSVALDAVDAGDNSALVRANHTRIAGRYDVNSLHQDIVQRVLALVRRYGDHFTAALDLCCGTGLAGPALRPLAGRLVGIDMTPGMLALAKTKEAYDRVEEAEAVSWLGATAERFDLVILADAMQYFKEIGPLVAGVGRVLHPAGLFVFSCDPATDDRETGATGAGEYAHSRSLLRHAAAVAGLAEIRIEVAMHRGHPGFYGVFRKE